MMHQKKSAEEWADVRKNARSYSVGLEPLVEGVMSQTQTEYLPTNTYDDI
jgi:hypothetical protein